MKQAAHVRVALNSTSKSHTSSQENRVSYRRRHEQWQRRARPRLNWRRRSRASSKECWSATCNTSHNQVPKLENPQRELAGVSYTEVPFSREMTNCCRALTKEIATDAGSRTRKSAPYRPPGRRVRAQSPGRGHQPVSELRASDTPSSWRSHTGTRILGPPIL